MPFYQRAIYSGVQCLTILITHKSRSRVCLPLFPVLHLQATSARLRWICVDIKNNQSNKLQPWHLIKNTQNVACGCRQVFNK